MPPTPRWLESPACTVAPACLGAMAGAMRFDDYLAAARTLVIDPAFWLPLLPPGLGQGTALVMESALGSLTLALAPRYDRVISWHASETIAARTRERLAAAGVGNVEVRIAPEPAVLDIEDGRLDVAFLGGPGTDLSRQWADARQLLGDAIVMSRRWLRPGGLLLVGENNAWSYRADIPPGFDAVPAGLPFVLAWRRMAATGLSIDAFHCSSTMGSAHLPLPDYVAQASEPQSAVLSKSTASRAKDWLLNRPLLRQAWPAYLALSRPATGTRAWWESLVASTGLAATMRWRPDEAIVVKRIVSGHAGMSILVAGPRGHAGCDVIVRVPRQAGGDQYCQRLFQTLKLLDTSALSSLIPRAIAVGSHAGLPYVVESRAPGMEAYAGTHGTDALLGTAAAMLGRLHAGASRHVVWSRDDVAARVDTWASSLLAQAGLARYPAIDKLGSLLADGLAGAPVRIGWTHGDYKLGNVLFNARHELTAIIDWDGFDEEGMQVFDYLTLLTYALASVHRCGLAAAYVRYILPWRLPGELGAAMAGAGAGCEPRVFLHLRAAFWLKLLHRRIEPVYKPHPAWQAEYLDGVLPAILDALAARS